MSVRGVPAQDLLENQDPGVMYRINEVTGERTPLVAPAPAVEAKEEAPKRRGRPPKVREEETPDAPAEGEGE